MLQSQIILLSLIGLVMLVITLFSGSNDLVIITGLAGMFAWGLATFGLFNVEIASGGSILSAGEYPALALFTLALALTCFWPALTGPVDLIGSSMREREPLNRGGL